MADRNGGGLVVVVVIFFFIRQEGSCGAPIRRRAQLG